jgi:hypothetical protein
MNALKSRSQHGSAGPLPLGSLSIARVGYEAMQLPGPGAFGPPEDHDRAVAVL